MLNTTVWTSCPGLLLGSAKLGSGICDLLIDRKSSGLTTTLYTEPDFICCKDMTGFRVPQSQEEGHVTWLWPVGNVNHWYKTSRPELLVSSFCKSLITFTPRPIHLYIFLYIFLFTRCRPLVVVWGSLLSVIKLCTKYEIQVRKIKRVSLDKSHAQSG